MADAARAWGSAWGSAWQVATCPPRWKASSKRPSSEGTASRLIAPSGRPACTRAARTISKDLALLVTTCAKRPRSSCLMLALLTESPSELNGRSGLPRRGMNSAKVVKEKYSTGGGTRASSTTASSLPSDHIGLGRSKPASGRAFHMYGVFGLAPNLSVNSFQKGVSRSRRKLPSAGQGWSLSNAQRARAGVQSLQTTHCPLVETDRPEAAAMAASKRRSSSATSGSVGFGGVGSSAPTKYARRAAAREPRAEQRVSHATQLPLRGDGAGLWDRCCRAICALRRCVRSRGAESALQLGRGC